MYNIELVANYREAFCLRVQHFNARADYGRHLLFSSNQTMQIFFRVGGEYKYVGALFLDILDIIWIWILQSYSL